MKKLHFILSILALTMFVGCQMPTDGTGNGFEAVDSTPTETTPTEGEDDNGDGEEAECPVDEDDSKPVDNTPTVDADEATYGFVKTVDYTVVANGQSLPGTKTGEELIAIAKAKNLIKDTDYTIDGTTVSLTESGVGKFFGNTGDGNTSSGDNTSTYTVDTVDILKDIYIAIPNLSYKLVIQNSPANGYKKGDQVEILITNGSYNVSTGIWGTPTELYLAKVSIRDNESKTNLDIDVTVKEHKIQFTMPAKNISVYALFIDATPRIETGEGQDCDGKFRIPNKSKNTAHIVLFWDSKDFDNLTYNENYGKYVWDVCDLNAGDVLFITDFCNKERGKPGMIVNNELIEIKPFLDHYWID